MSMAMADLPRYPEILVEIQSRNPLALVAAVREALRLAHVRRSEISEFSDEAFSSDSPQEVQQVCEEWVTVEPKQEN